MSERPSARLWTATALAATLAALLAPGAANAADRIYWANFGAPERISFANLDGSGGTNLNTAGALVKMEGKDSGAGGTIIYFSCADCAVEAGRAAQHGGKVVKEKFSIGQYGFIAFVEDTEGNMIGLHSIR